MKIAQRWKLKNYSELKSDWPRCFKVVTAIQNNKKKSAAWAGTFVIVAMCIFPPWVPDNIVEVGGERRYDFLFSNGIFIEAYPFAIVYCHIDTVRLVIQCVIVSLITGALLYNLKDKKAEGGGK